LSGRNCCSTRGICQTKIFAFNRHARPDSYRARHLKVARRPVVHANSHVIHRDALHVLLDLISRIGTAGSTDYRHGGFAISAADLVTQQAAQYTTSYGSEADSGVAHSHAIYLARPLDSGNSFYGAAIGAHIRSSNHRRQRT